MYLVKAQIQASFYPRMAHTTVFALHPEAIILGWLLQRLRLLPGKLQYIKQQILTSVEGPTQVIFTDCDDFLKTYVVTISS